MLLLWWSGGRKKEDGQRPLISYAPPQMFYITGIPKHLGVYCISTASPYDVTSYSLRGWSKLHVAWSLQSLFWHLGRNRNMWNMGFSISYIFLVCKTIIIYTAQKPSADLNRRQPLHCRYSSVHDWTHDPAIKVIGNSLLSPKSVKWVSSFKSWTVS